MLDVPPQPALEVPPSSRGRNPRAWIGAVGSPPRGSLLPPPPNDIQQAPRVFADLTNSSRKRAQRPNDGPTTTSSTSTTVDAASIRSPDFNEVTRALQSRCVRGHARRSDDRSEKSLSPYSPHKTSTVPPPPPLIAILAQQQQQKHQPHQGHTRLSPAQCDGDGTTSSRRHDAPAELGATDASTAAEALRIHTIPQPPPTTATQESIVVSSNNSTGNVGGGSQATVPPAQQKILTKYHFLKNFAVKPKTPSSKEKVRRGGVGGGRRGAERRGEISPLPVAPPCPPAIVALSAGCEAYGHPRPQPNAVPLPDPQGNYHRTIGQLSDRPTVVLSPTLRAGGQHLPTKRCGPTLVSILAPQPSTPPTVAPMAAGNQRRGGAQLAAVGGGGGVPIAKRSFPTPAAAAKEVARSLMDDLDEDIAVPLMTAAGVDFFDDDDDHEDVAHQLYSTTDWSPNEAQPAPILPNDFITPRFGSTGSRAPTQERASGDSASYEGCAGVSSFVLPSPTTLGSSDPTVTQASIATPHSVASTAEGVPFDLLDFEDDVSPMTEDDDGEGRAVCDVAGHRVDGSLYRFFEEARLTADAAVALKAQQLEQDHTRVGRLLLQEAGGEVLSALMADSALRALVAAWWHAQAQDAMCICLAQKQSLSFLYGYNAVVAIPVAMPLLEAHGRRLLLMRRDLFMRGAVRKFVRLMPRHGRRAGKSGEGIALERMRSNGFESLENRHQRYRKPHSGTRPKHAVPPPLADDSNRMPGHAAYDEAATGTDQEECERDDMGGDAATSRTTRVDASSSRDGDGSFAPW